MTDDDVTRLWRCRRTIFQMLQDRDYMVGRNCLLESREDVSQALSEVRNRESLVIFVRHRSDPTETLVVYFPDEQGKKVGVRPIANLVSKMEEKNIPRAILVCREKLTSFAKEALSMSSSKQRIEVFMESELLVNITEHELVPRHVPLSEVDKKALLERYKVRADQLPRITRDDPVAKYYGLERGQVVKIIRPSETAGRYVTYRLCI
ncbi:unnamed protein product [Vitrella brassicaformis CCMP3155]|uniref:RNA polymerase subunit H/Rpb5 C-terminal domain-containing protein n=1 Tax=Vitrella brassicaformis (strain CCMP3155) TaxID=1169540 RepID=A0A0G4F640_VITBC|nr:unnamed protein product [Vitrella brassicaformis CCMP3155]|mmetsp:Transcript_25012/g.61894  ORF Transcript_25012/g.61894 Transcript_25012/m.61894 type:complete len:207 (-) Transcript_25012:176-796(-)|eukprot:CEM07847.1 unnamed protein product [Vitrella brassicaformis CCMP3155]